MQERIIRGNLVVKNEWCCLKGKIIVEGTVFINDGKLFIDGDLDILSANRITHINNGSIYAKSIFTKSDIHIKNGTICTSECLRSANIISADADTNIIVFKNAQVLDVSCRNYLVDGSNDSGDIKASESIYILGDSNSSNLISPEVFIGNNADFNHCFITTNHFESGGHVRNCMGLHKYENKL